MAQVSGPLLFMTRRQGLSLHTLPSIQGRLLSCLGPRRKDASMPVGMQRPRQTMKSSSPSFNKVMTFPSDMGLLEGTFVSPTGNNAPSIFSTPRDFIWLRWRWLKARCKDRLSLLLYKVSSPKGDDARWLSRMVQLRRGRIASEAMRLHRTMYGAFADGDMETIKLVCTSGMRDSFKSRLHARPTGERVEWKILKFTRTPRVVSDRAVRLPTDGFGLRQAVVKLSTRQKLTRFGRNGELVQGSGKERDVLEYLVVQKMYKLWKEDNWKVWGTTEETTVKRLEEWDRKSMES